MCVKNGVVEGTPGNLDERIAAVDGPVGGVGPVGILIGVVRPDSPCSEPLFGPFGPEICALAAELASQSGGAARAAYIAGDTTNEPPARVGDVTLSRTGDEALTVTIKVLGHKRRGACATVRDAGRKYGAGALVRACDGVTCPVCSAPRRVRN